MRRGAAVPGAGGSAPTIVELLDEHGGGLDDDDAVRDVVDDGASLVAVLGGGGGASHAAPEPDGAAPASPATAHAQGEPQHAAALPVDELLLRLVDVGNEVTSVMLGPIKGVRQPRPRSPPRERAAPRRI